ncbi:hypothetical protein Pla52o_45970 [Novipirellula galeiformis]|uniref:Uncharacterized protein n=1 Tax=Novipirellula galeiformis TaxID=2528004 RepID=A0A5C6C655_9BACT|nr:hypothetical protein Pla52o_45970 [Novipirellula galeiformis]
MLMAICDPPGTPSCLPPHSLYRTIANQSHRDHRTVSVAMAVVKQILQQLVLLVVRQFLRWRQLHPTWNRPTSPPPLRVLGNESLKREAAKDAEPTTVTSAPRFSAPLHSPRFIRPRDDRKISRTVPFFLRVPR